MQDDLSLTHPVSLPRRTALNQCGKGIGILGKTFHP